MTKLELIEQLKEYPDNMPIMILIPSVILDDGYIEESQVRQINEVYLSDTRPAIMLDYDRYTVHL
jgi:hypothetical protein